MKSDADDAEFQPLASLLAAQSEEKIAVARSKLETTGRDGLIALSRSSFTSGKRVVFHLTNDELTRRGIPPTFRHDHRSQPPTTLEQKFDLLVADLRWLRYWYSDHVKNVRYQRCKILLTGTETPFHREAEYAFWEGKRPAWRIVQSLSLNQRQQWDCVWLRSAPVKKHEAETQAMCDQVFSALQDDLHTVRRTSSFTDNDAHATLTRRFNLWFCSRMADNSPAETARRYMQMTGREITRDVAARQLQKVREALSAKRVAASHKKRGKIV